MSPLMCYFAISTLQSCAARSNYEDMAAFEVTHNNHLVIFFVELMSVLTIGLDASSSMFMSLMSCRVGGPRTSTISTN